MGDQGHAASPVAASQPQDTPTAATANMEAKVKGRIATEKDEEQIAVARTLKHIPWCDAYERMISGMLYDPWVQPLSIARYNARAWCHHYNSYFPVIDPTVDPLAASTQRQLLLSNILGSVGENAWIEPPFNFDYGCNIRVGSRFYANFNLTILDGALVTFGDRVLVGPNVSVYSVNHETDVRSRRADVEYARPVVVGNDCWIAGNVVILPGVRIGKGVTVGAGSVVTRDVPDWCVVVGSPARVVKMVEPVEGTDEVEEAVSERPAEVRGG